MSEYYAYKVTVIKSYDGMALSRSTYHMSCLGALCRAFSYMMDYRTISIKIEPVSERDYFSDKL